MIYTYQLRCKDNHCYVVIVPGEPPKPIAKEPLREQIVQFLRANQTATIAEIVKVTGKMRETINNEIRILRNLGRVEIARSEKGKHKTYFVYKLVER